MNYKIFFIAIVIIFLLYIKYSFIGFNKEVYKWHCKNIYPFDKNLSFVETNYIKKCIQLSYWELLRPLYCIFDPFIKRLSYFTYSHRIIDGKCNSSRIAYGSVIQSKKAYIYAKKVLHERNIQSEIIPNSNIAFGGLGWDIQNNHFKIYFRFYDFKKLSDTYKELLPDMINNYQSGLLSITYNKNNKIIERKIYCYPIFEMVATLQSIYRKDIQHDCHNNNKWVDKLDKTGLKILDIYKNKYKLDTITYKNKENYTMYFPMIG